MHYLESRLFIRECVVFNIFLLMIYALYSLNPGTSAGLWLDAPQFTIWYHTVAWRSEPKDEEWINQQFIFGNRQNGPMNQKTKAREFNLKLCNERIWTYFGENGEIISINDCIKSWTFVWLSSWIENNTNNFHVFIQVQCSSINLVHPWTTISNCKSRRAY